MLEPPESPDPQAETPVRPSRWVLAWLVLELLALFFAVPALLAVLMDPLDRARPLLDPIGLAWLCDLEVNRGLLVFPVLLSTTGAIVLYLVLSPTFETGRLWAWSRARAGLGRVATIFGVNAVVITLLAFLLAYGTNVLPEEGFFNLPRRAPVFLLILWLAYPVFSAYPQEITHRAFFFHRYRPLLAGRWTMIVVNAVAFAWLHVMFWNWIALVLTFCGGLLFAYTYDRSRSTLLAGLEHGLYGNWVFATGLGWFVYTGSVGS